MRHVKKIILLTAITCLGLWIVTPLIREILHLEFASDSIKYNYREFLLFAVPLAMILTLLETLRLNDSMATKIIKSIVTIIIAGWTAFIILISMFDMCSWTNRQVLYMHKNDSNIKIIVKDFECGATDSGELLTGVYQVQTITKYFIRSTKIDTTEIDKSEWIKVK